MQRKSILIIEDDESIRDTFKLALEYYGYQVFTAANGKEGLETITKMPCPGLIVLDLMMPVLDGWGFTEAIAQIKSLEKVPVIVTTAFTEIPKPIRASEIIRKPMDVDFLIKMARQYCGNDKSTESA